MKSSFIHEQFEVGPFLCNCHILVSGETGEAIVVDPGDEYGVIAENLKKISAKIGKPVSVTKLFHTHAHLDHINATRELKDDAAIIGLKKVCLHKGDHQIYQILPQQRALFGFPAGDAAPPVEHWLEDGEEFKLGSIKLSVVHTPGHSPGGVCLKIDSDEAAEVPPQVLTGDTLFRESIGRTDLWEGDMDLLLGSIRKRLFTLDQETLVHPGHGPSSSIRHERKNNPFLN